MSIEVRLTDNAKDDLSNMQDKEEKEARKALDELRDRGISHPKVLLIEDQDLGGCYRLKVDSGEANHRAFFDVEGEPHRIVVHTIPHRNEAYSTA